MKLFMYELNINIKLNKMKKMTIKSEVINRVDNVLKQNKKWYESNEFKTDSFYNYSSPSYLTYEGKIMLDYLQKLGYGFYKIEYLRSIGFDFPKYNKGKGMHGNATVIMKINNSII